MKVTQSKFLLISAASILGFGIVVSFVVPSANASSTTTSVVATAPDVPQAPSAEEAPSAGVDAGIDCNNGLDATGAQCDGGPSANPTDGGLDSQTAADSESEVTNGTDGDNVQN